MGKNPPTQGLILSFLFLAENDEENDEEEEEEGVSTTSTISKTTIRQEQGYDQANTNKQELWISWERLCTHPPPHRQPQPYSNESSTDNIKPRTTSMDQSCFYSWILASHASPSAKSFFAHRL